MSQKLPQLRPAELITLLKKAGWEEHRRAPHGVVMKKLVCGKTLVTTIADHKSPMPPGTLRAILGSEQTNLGRAGLQRLLKKGKAHERR